MLSNEAHVHLAVIAEMSGLPCAAAVDASCRHARVCPPYYNLELDGYEPAARPEVLKHCPSALPPRRSDPPTHDVK
jgi:hypothetical protein